MLATKAAGSTQPRQAVVCGGAGGAVGLSSGVHARSRPRQVTELLPPAVDGERVAGMGWIRPVVCHPLAMNFTEPGPSVSVGIRQT